MRPTLIFAWPELTRPANSSIRFGLLPAALITVGCAISVGIRGYGLEWRVAGETHATSLEAISGQRRRPGVLLRLRRGHRAGNPPRAHPRPRPPRKTHLARQR